MLTPPIEKINNIIKENGDTIRQQFFFAGLFIMVFEQFKRFVVGTVDGFFAKKSELGEKNICRTRGEEFKKIIKSHGKGKTGQHTSEPFRTALVWFQNMNAISAEEINRIEKLALVRNDIGHELFNICVDDEKPYIKIEDTYFMLDIYQKIFRWWLAEIEATTNPEFIENKYSKTGCQSAETGETLLLKEILNKILNLSKQESGCVP